MNKMARKPSADPVQEKLRQNKTVWNKEVSVFIDNLIHFKKMMNGMPSKFHQEKSNIKEPIPADPVTILGVLVSDFNEIAQKGNQITDEQLSYSKTRRKKQVVTPNQPANISLPPLKSSLDQIEELEVLASNKLTRFLSRLKGPWFGSSPEARKRRHRISFLNSCVGLNKIYDELEYEILGSSPESIFISSRLISKLEDDLYVLAKSLDNYATEFKSEKTQNVSTPSEIDVTKNEPVKQENPILDDSTFKLVESIKLDYRNNQDNFTDIDSDLEKFFLQAVTIYDGAQSRKDREQAAKNVINLYKSILLSLNAARGTNASSLSELINQKKASYQLQVVADNMVGKWFRKTKQKLNVMDKTHATRLDIAERAKQSKKILDEAMNSLSKDLDPEIIKVYLSSLTEIFIKIKELIKPLEAYIRGKGYTSQFINLLERGKLTDQTIDLSKDQKEKFKKMLETKELRNLSKLQGLK
jgi:hypothetical protein